MRTSRLLLASVLACTAGVGLWACVANSPDGSGGTGGTAGAGTGGTGGITGSGGTSPTTSTTNVVCTIDNGADPVGFCTQKLVLKGEHAVAFDPKRGVAQSWDSTTLIPDEDASHAVLHDPRDDAAYSAAVSLYVQSAMVYGDNEITNTVISDLLQLSTTLLAELTPPPAGYAGEIYQDLRTTAGGYRFAVRNDLGDAADAIADAYGRAIYNTYFAALGGADAGAPDGGPPDGGPPPDGILGTPAAGGGVAYAPGDVATGALALMDMAVRHATAEPANAALWQEAAASALAHLDARARDPQTGLYYAALVTSADPGHDALAPASASGPPSDALLTEVAGRVALALTRAQDLVNKNPTVLPALISLPLEKRGEDLITALDATPKSLWDASGGISDGDGGTLGSGYFEGFVPSTATLLADKPTRANALVMAALHRAAFQGAPPNGVRVRGLRALFSDTLHANTGLISVVSGQNGYFRQVPPTFTFVGTDAGADPRRKSYFSSANADAVEGLSELWVGVPM